MVIASKEEVKSWNYEFEIHEIEVILKTMKLDKVTKGMSPDREEKPDGLSPRKCQGEEFGKKVKEPAKQTEKEQTLTRRSNEETVI